MVEFLLGMNGVAYASGTAGTALASCTAITNIKDLKLDCSAGEADITTRANSGFRATAPTLKEMSIDFQMKWLPGDTGFDMIRTAFLANATIEFAALDQARTVSGAQGPKGSWSITKFSKDESLEGAQMVDVTLKLSTYSEWVVI